MIPVIIKTVLNLFIYIIINYLENSHFCQKYQKIFFFYYNLNEQWYLLLIETAGADTLKKYLFRIKWFRKDILRP